MSRAVKMLREATDDVSDEIRWLQQQRDALLEAAEKASRSMRTGGEGGRVWMADDYDIGDWLALEKAIARVKRGNA